MTRSNRTTCFRAQGDIMEIERSRCIACFGVQGRRFVCFALASFAAAGGSACHTWRTTTHWSAPIRPE